jgi:hypothetical protein
MTDNRHTFYIEVDDMDSKQILALIEMFQAR